MEPDEHTADAVTYGTAQRSTSIIAPHRAYSQQPYLTTTRREGNDHHAGREGIVAASESFFPSFLRNSRHYFQPSDGDRYKTTITGRAKYPETAILGSGDFGVLKGGTFYQDNDPPLKSYYNDFIGLNINNHNGHQRPFASPLVQKIRYPSDSLDPFSNFRDFADINVSNDAGQYSEFFVVYANSNSSVVPAEKNGAEFHNEKHIQNIKDQLDLIDKEINMENKLSKRSKSKVKLAKFRKQACKNCLTNRQNMVSSTTLNSDTDKDFMLALS